MAGTDSKGEAGALSDRQRLRALQQPQLKLKRINFRSDVVGHPFCSALTCKPRHGLSNRTRRTQSAPPKKYLTDPINELGEHMPKFLTRRKT